VLLRNCLLTHSVIFNSAINFVLMLCFGAKFRQMLHQAPSEWRSGTLYRPVLGSSRLPVEVLYMQVLHLDRYLFVRTTLAGYSTWCRGWLVEANLGNSSTLGKQVY